MHFLANLRTERVAARVTPEQKRLLQRAAELTGRSLTDFILSSAQEKAEETLRTHRVSSSAICLSSTLGRETAMKSFETTSADIEKAILSGMVILALPHHVAGAQ